MTFLDHLECFRCARTYPPGKLFQGCPACSAERPSNLFCVYDYQGLKRSFSKTALQRRSPSMWRYLELLPVGEEHVVTLHEGMTPLIHCPRLGRRYGLKRLYVKDESRNPTWSFKDRLASAGASKAREMGCHVLAVASTGNAGAATAAYAARAGMQAAIFTTADMPSTMRVLMQSYGARVYAVPTMADRWQMVQRGVQERGWFPVQNFMVPPLGANPYSLDGAKTMGFELCEQLDWHPPDVVVAPVTVGDLPVGAWRGFLEFREMGLVDRVPRMVAAEVFGPLSNALAQGLDHTEAMPTHPTVAVSAGAANSTFQSLRMVRDTGGTAVVASDQEIMQAQLELAETEGIYAEASSTLALAALKKLAVAGQVREDEVAVVLLTSTGLKDPEVTRPYLPEMRLLDQSMFEVL